MQIEVSNPVAGLKPSFFSECVELVLSGENKPAEYVNVVFLPRDDLRQLKKEYFGLDVYTDVITFNLNNPDEILEGEIYLSFEQIEENAGLFKTKPIDELRRILIHGCLHLCGYEDDTQVLKDQMTDLENQYIENLLNTEH